MVNVWHAEVQLCAVDAMELPYVLFVKEEAALLQQGMVLTFLVLLVTSQANVKSVKVLVSACVLVLNFLDIPLEQTLSMDLMEESYPPKVLGVVVVLLLLVLPRHRVRARHHLHVVLAVVVEEQALTQLLQEEEACLRGELIITKKE